MTTTLREYPEVEQGSEEWHTQRRGLVTASVVGQLLSVGYLGAEAHGCPDCGAEPYDPCRSKVKPKGFDRGPIIKTYHTARTDEALSHRDDRHLLIEPANTDTARNLTTLLVAERITGFTEPTRMTDDMWRGVEDEPRAVDVYSEHYAPVDSMGFMVREGDGWKVGYSPDGLVGNDGLVEVKSRRQKTQLTTILSGEIPAANMAQLQCGLLVSGRKWVDYISYSGGMHLWVKRITPDDRWFHAIIQAAIAFEQTAGQMVAAYFEATKGLPMTERVVEQEMSL